MKVINKNLKEKGGVKGIITFTNFLLKGKRAHEINNYLKINTNIKKSLYDKLIIELHSLCKVREFKLENLVVLSGRSVLARLLDGDTTYSGEINYGALGTGSTAVSASDTTLDTEVFRKTIATRIRSGSQVTIDFYYSKSDTDGTYEEFGCFIDGTATVDTGQLFNRLLTGGWTKSALESMTISVQIDINAA